MGSVRKNVTMTDRTIQTIREIREIEDVASDSEAIRKAIQFYRERLDTHPDPTDDTPPPVRDPEFLREAIKVYEAALKRTG